MTIETIFWKRGEVKFLAFKQIKKMFNIKSRNQLNDIETDIFINPHNNKPFIAYNFCQVEERCSDRKKESSDFVVWF